MTSVYDYSDYRLFLKDRFFEMKKRNPLFSYRSFNRLAGLKNSGFLKLVIDGKKNLGETGIRKIARGFKLSEAETRYFASLVRFNQAIDQEEKEHYFGELGKSRASAEVQPPSAVQNHFISRWHYFQGD